MILSRNTKNDLASNNTSVIPVIVIERNDSAMSVDGYDAENTDGYIAISTHDLQFYSVTGEIYNTLPILLDVPRIKESINFKTNKIKTASCEINISTATIRDDNILRMFDFSGLVDTNVSIYYKTQSSTKITHSWNIDSFDYDEGISMLFVGRIRKVVHNQKQVKIHLEDEVHKKIDRDLPLNYIRDNAPDKYINKPVPRVFGFVKMCPTIERFNSEGQLEISAGDNIQAINSGDGNLYDEPPHGSEYPDFHWYNDIGTEGDTTSSNRYHLAVYKEQTWHYVTHTAFNFVKYQESTGRRYGYTLPEGDENLENWDNFDGVQTTIINDTNVILNTSNPFLQKDKLQVHVIKHPQQIKLYRLSSPSFNNWISLDNLQYVDDFDEGSFQGAYPTSDVGTFMTGFFWEDVTSAQLISQEGYDQLTDNEFGYTRVGNVYSDFARTTFTQSEETEIGIVHMFGNNESDLNEGSVFAPGFALIFDHGVKHLKYHRIIGVRTRHETGLTTDTQMNFPTRGNADFAPQQGVDNRPNNDAYGNYAAEQYYGFNGWRESSTFYLHSMVSGFISHDVMRKTNESIPSNYNYEHEFGGGYKHFFTAAGGFRMPGGFSGAVRPPESWAETFNTWKTKLGQEMGFEINTENNWFEFNLDGRNTSAGHIWVDNTVDGWTHDPQTWSGGFQMPDVVPAMMFFEGQDLIYLKNQSSTLSDGYGGAYAALGEEIGWSNTSYVALLGGQSYWSKEDMNVTGNTEIQVYGRTSMGVNFTIDDVKMAVAGELEGVSDAKYFMPGVQGEAIIGENDLVVGAGTLIIHLCEELGVDTEHTSTNEWTVRDNNLDSDYVGERSRFSVVINKATNVKKLFDDILKERNGCMASNGRGQMKFHTRYDTISSSQFTYSRRIIDRDDVLSYKIKMSSSKDIVSKMTYGYDWNHATNKPQFYDKRSDIRTYSMQDDIGSTSNNETNVQFDLEMSETEMNFYGIENVEDNAKEIKYKYAMGIWADRGNRYYTPYILSTNYYMQHKANRLNIELELPLSYIDIELGDMIAFRINELLDDKKAYGINYTIYQAFGGVIRCPGFQVTSVTRNLDKIKVQAEQIHDHRPPSYMRNANDENDPSGFPNYSGFISQGGIGVTFQQLYNMGAVDLDDPMFRSGVELTYDSVIDIGGTSVEFQPLANGTDILFGVNSFFEDADGNIIPSANKRIFKISDIDNWHTNGGYDFFECYLNGTNEQSHLNFFAEYYWSCYNYEGLNWVEKYFLPLDDGTFLQIFGDPIESESVFNTLYGNYGGGNYSWDQLISYSTISSDFNENNYHSFTVQQLYKHLLKPEIWDLNSFDELIPNANVLAGMTPHEIQSFTAIQIWLPVSDDANPYTGMYLKLCNIKDTKHDTDKWRFDTPVSDQMYYMYGDESFRPTGQEFDPRSTGYDTYLTQADIDSSGIDDEHFYLASTTEIKLGWVLFTNYEDAVGGGTVYGANYGAMGGASVTYPLDVIPIIMLKQDIAQMEQNVTGSQYNMNGAPGSVGTATNEDFVSSYPDLGASDPTGNEYYGYYVNSNFMFPVLLGKRYSWQDKERYLAVDFKVGDESTRRWRPTIPVQLVNQYYAGTGDVNNNGQIDEGDLNALLTWILWYQNLSISSGGFIDEFALTSVYPELANMDLNNDGFIDFEDYDMLVEILGIEMSTGYSNYEKTSDLIIDYDPLDFYPEDKDYSTQLISRESK